MAIIADDAAIRTQYFVSADVVSLLVSTFALPILVLWAWQRWPKGGKDGLTVATALCLLCYATTFLYTFLVTVLVHVQWMQTEALCNTMMIACVLLHNGSKAAEYAFLIERAYIISWQRRPRRRTPEYVLSGLLIMLPYIAVTILAIRFRIAFMITDKICIIGQRTFTLIPMLTIELCAQLVLTLRFLIPLITLHRNGSGLLMPLRNAVLRTTIGCAITMLLNVAVKISLLLFNGEPAWLCFLTCKIEAFLAACLLHWITKPILSDAERQPERRFDADGNDHSAGSSRELDLQEMLGRPAQKDAPDSARK